MQSLNEVQQEWKKKFEAEMQSLDHSRFLLSQDLEDLNKQQAFERTLELADEYVKTFDRNFDRNTLNDFESIFDWAGFKEPLMDIKKSFDKTCEKFKAIKADLTASKFEDDDVGEFEAVKLEQCVDLMDAIERGSTNLISLLDDLAKELVIQNGSDSEGSLV